MIGIHVRDGIGFGFNKRFRIGDIGEDVFGLEIDNTAEPRHQMRAGDFHAIKGKVGETCVHFRIRMTPQIGGRRRGIVVFDCSGP